ncbi:MAG: hypothetical protein ACYTAF_03670 [Planctomycetota bacterium]|jgi:hypothetical protein
MKHLALGLLALALASGCTASYRPRSRPKPGALDRFRSVIVYQLNVKPWLRLNPHIQSNAAYAKHLAQVEAAKIEVPGYAIKKLRGHFNVVREPGKDTLLVKSELIHYDPKTARGMRVVRVRVRLIDGVSKATIATYEAQGKSFVVSMRAAFHECGEAIARYILDQAGESYVPNIPEP